MKTEFNIENDSSSLSEKNKNINTQIDLELICTTNPKRQTQALPADPMIHDNSTDRTVFCAGDVIL